MKGLGPYVGFCKVDRRKKNSKIQDLKLQHYEQLTMQLDRESKDCVLKLLFGEERQK